MKKRPSLIQTVKFECDWSNGKSMVGYLKSLKQESLVWIGGMPLPPTIQSSIKLQVFKSVLCPCLSQQHSNLVDVLMFECSFQLQVYFFDSTGFKYSFPFPCSFRTWLSINDLIFFNFRFDSRNQCWTFCVVCWDGSLYLQAEKEICERTVHFF